MGSVNLQVHLITLHIKYNIFHFDDIKLSVVIKQNNQNIGGVSTKIVALFWQTQFFGIDIDTIMHIYFLSIWCLPIQPLLFEIFSATLTFHEFSQR